jgi:hypothetical protein
MANLSGHLEFQPRRFKITYSLLTPLFQLGLSLGQSGWQAKETNTQQTDRKTG